MSFLQWALSPATLLGLILMVPLLRGQLKQGSLKVICFAVSNNLMLYAGAKLHLQLTGQVVAVGTSIVGLSLALFVPADLLRRPSSFDTCQQDDDDRRFLLATTIYRDITTNIFEVLMCFSGQSLLVAMYMAKLCSRYTLKHEEWFRTDLWLCGWVAQSIVGTQFAFDVAQEVYFWKVMMNWSHGVVQTTKTGTVSTSPVDWKGLLLRSALAVVVQTIYRMVIWMTLPVYFAMRNDGLNCAIEVAPLIYIMCMSNLTHPIQIESRPPADCLDDEDEDVQLLASPSARSDDRPEGDHEVDIEDGEAVKRRADRQAVQSDEESGNRRCGESPRQVVFSDDESPFEQLEQALLS
eukprot:TRINITY_DN25441_c0_g1_i2.p1 TRINITY_DN25441_c0_g1~~TRINITY_DN25441_c0_g1_i2.p1  ORF type:complete len:351 (+),score=61.17 TRINITY_DN25441_c0_g1_i2:63-1115(+)